MFFQRFMPRGFARALLAREHGIGTEDVPPAPGKGSVAYRENRDAIWRARIPKKYTRLAKHIPGARILEFGAAEGVLALLLSRDREKVVALEKNRTRHEESLRLQAHWKAVGIDVDRCEMVHADITQRYDLLQGMDTVLAVRTIYYLKDDVQRVFETIGEHVENVVLCGNKRRARWYQETSYPADGNLGPYNFYASVEGMTSVLEKAGYSIVKVVDEGDPIVVGAKRLSRSDALSSPNAKARKL
jgi:hypothetical protein